MDSYNEVDTSKLLERLEQTAGSETLAQAATEAVEVGGLAKGQLVLMVGSDLAKLFDDSRVLDIESPQAGKRPGGFLGFALLDEVTRGLGEDKHSSDEDDGPCELDGNGNAVGARVVAVLGGVADDGSEEQTDGDGELVATDDSTTNPLGRSLGLVEGDEGADHADTVASEETTGNEHGNGSSGGLQDHTQSEDGGGDDQTIATAEEVTSRTSSESTEESSGRENGDDLGSLRGGDVQMVRLGVDVAGGELVLPVVHTQDVTNGTRVISVQLSEPGVVQGGCRSYVPEQNTTKGNEQANGNGWKSRAGGVGGLLEKERHSCWRVRDCCRCKRAGSRKRGVRV